MFDWRATAEAETAYIASVRKGGQLLACLSILVASAVLVFGWGLDVDFARRISPGFPAMVPATALTLIFGGIGTFALLMRWPGSVPLLSGLLCLGIVVLESVASLTPDPFRTNDAMSAASAICAVLLGVSLCTRARSLISLSIGIETLGLVVALVPLIGYYFGASTLFNNPIYTQMALHTVLLHCLLFLALLLADHDRGWISVLFAEEIGSYIARRVLPVAIFAPLGLALLASLAVRQQFMTVEFRLAILTFLIIGSTVTAIITFAFIANRSERKTIAAEAAYQRSERQRQETELALTRSEKIAALGKLVGGVAHDFNNTLNVIIGSLELINEDPDETRHPGYVDEAMTASLRAATLTRQLLAYGRKSRLDPKNHRVADELDAALGMFERVCPSSIAVVRDIAASGVVCNLDANAFQQAMLNILINARDALQNSGEIRIGLRVEDLKGVAVAGFLDAEPLPEGRYATIRIEDTGTGMSPEIVARASEPFFTTKPIGEGTGMGLSSAVGFCRQSDGGLRLDSTPGIGTTVTLAFPVVSIDDRRKDDPPALAVSADGIGRNVMIVDDDQAITRTMARQLELAGHSVRVTHNAEEALEALDAGALPDVMVIDIVMPGEMQGHSLAARIRQRYPGIQIVLISGFASAAQRNNIPAIVSLPFLQKPVDLRTLRTVISAPEELHQRDDRY